MRTLGLVLVVLAHSLSAQTPDTTHHQTGVSVSGVVHDSIAHKPLAGATVELVSASSPGSYAVTTTSDSAGRFTLSDVPAGRHMIGFFHPMLDSIGIDSPLREILIDGLNVAADLAIPSAQRVRAAICGKKSQSDSSAVVVGIVRDARDGSPAAGATVMAEWVEISFRNRGYLRRIPRLTVTTADNGWFALCNVPSAGTMAIIASRGTDSTDVIEINIPPGGFLRHELFLGSARTVVTTGVGQQAGKTVAMHRLRTGDGALTGTVVTADRGVPIVGAQVGIADGPQTITNERGEWTLADAPIGSRMLEIKALGYYSQRRKVDVVASSQPVRIALSTLKAMLDTVRITASRLHSDQLGFEERRKIGSGHYLTETDIVRAQPLVASDIFRLLPGVHYSYDADNLTKRVFMRGIYGACQPSLYINGLPMTSLVADSVKSGVPVLSLSADDLDTWIRPKDITGVELYKEDNTPIEFQQAGSGCGAILIWTRLRK